MGKLYWIIEVRQDERAKDGTWNPPEKFFYPATVYAKDEALADAKKNCKPGQKAYFAGEEHD